MQLSRILVWPMPNKFSSKFSRTRMIESVAESLLAAGVGFGHGTDNEWDEAAWLVMHVLGCDPQEPLPEPELLLSAQQQQQVAELLQQRIASRKPLAYLLNSAWFCGLEFFVDERVIVPRSPIAELIQNEFRPWLAKPPLSILDLCTGSGCIAIACALMFPAAEVAASDISPDALAVTEINLERYAVQDRIQRYQADVFDGIPVRQYDLLVSNPPYVDVDDMAALPLEYRREPQLALAAGHDGLNIVRRILREAGRYLSPAGVLIVEVGNSQAALEAAFPHVPFTWLEFEHGDDGVFMLTAAELIEYAGYFK
jgi:ribosomal protein L3 glutamine methyltransferase